MNPTERRTASSSSTTWTSFASELITFSGPLDGEVEGGPAIRRRIAPDAAAMPFDDRSADRQADAHTCLLGRDERLEQLRCNSLADPAAGVLDANLDKARRLGLGRDPERTDR